MTTYKGKWALVTGASAGIGAEFARALAARGANVILTARREDRLARLAEELREGNGVETLAIPADFSKPEAPEHVMDSIAAANARVDILINNAGYGLPGAFVDSDWEAHRRFIEVMITSYAHFARAVLPDMRARNYGRIVQVASLAGLTPGAAGHTLYGASKAFLVSFSQSLAAENADRDIKVSALCPGFTYSEFHDVNKTRKLVSLLPKFTFMEAAPVVEKGLAAVERGHVVYTPGLWNKFTAFVMNALPRPWAAAMVKGQSRKFRGRAVSLGEKT